MNTVVEVIKTKEVVIWEPPTHSPASYFNNPVYETEKIDVDLELTSKKKPMRYLLWYLNFMKLCSRGYLFINDFKTDDQN